MISCSEPTAWSSKRARHGATAASFAYNGNMNAVEFEGPVESFEWGSYVVSGESFGKDIRVVGARGSEWKERKGHELTAKMITGLEPTAVDVLVIGNGVEGALRCPENVLSEVRGMGFGRVVVMKTPEACREYNRLYRSGLRAAMLAHGTC